MRSILIALCWFALAVMPASAQAWLGFQFRPLGQGPTPGQLQAARQLAMVRAVTPVPPALAPYWQQQAVQPPPAAVFGAMNPGQLQAARQLSMVRAITPVPPALAAYWQQPVQPAAGDATQPQSIRQLAMARALNPGIALPAPLTSIPGAAPGGGLFNSEACMSGSDTGFSGNACTLTTGASWANLWNSPNSRHAGHAHSARFSSPFQSGSPAGSSRQRLLVAPTPSDITSGTAMNLLLDRIALGRTKVSPGTGNPLEGELLRRLTVTGARSSDTIGVLRSQFPWPTAVTKVLSESQQAQMQQQVRTVYEQARQGQPDMMLLKSLREAVGATTDQLRSSYNDFTPAQYRQGQQFLSNFAFGLNAVGNGELAATVDLQNFANGGKNVNEVVGFMLGRGLRFAPPAGTEDAAAYRAVYDAMSAFVLPPSGE